MKITQITKASGNLLVLTIDEGDKERAFVIATYSLDELNRLADTFAALICLQNLEEVE